MGLPSSRLLDLLAKRHSKDVFVSECKNGPTWFGSHRRLDAWAMKKSWAHPDIYGYEIKVSRSDFLADNKWQDYLPCCSQFYFVSPAKIIRPDELPGEAGLLYASSTGTRLYTKKKSPRRQIEMPEAVFRYILMSRCEIVGERSGRDSEQNLAYWRSWLETKKITASLGYVVSRALQRRIDEEVEAARVENNKLKKRIERVEKMEAVLQRFGIDPKAWRPEYDIERRCAEVYGKAPPKLLHNIEQLTEQLSAFAKKLKAGQIPLFGEQE